MFFLPEKFSFPADLEQALRLGLWRGNDPSEKELEKLGTQLRALWPKLAQERGFQPAGAAHYSFRREDAEAYAAYYLPANALKVALVLEESYLLGKDLLADPAIWLDVGTGPGTAYWGAAWWCSRRGKKLRFTGWDQSSLFTEKAREMTARNPLGQEAHFVAADKNSDSYFALVRKLAPTHLSFVNSLAEIYPEPEARHAALEKLSSLLRELTRKDGKERWVLLIEPGSRTSARELAATKDHLQNKGAAHLLLPCLDNRACGALANPKDWCHEEAACDFPAWLNQIGAVAGLRKESLLFSYALYSPAALPALFPDGKRIVSQRLERKGQVECRICTREGKQLVRVQHSKAHAENEFFLKSCRGEIWKSAAWEAKGDLLQAERVPPGKETIFS